MSLRLADGDDIPALAALHASAFETPWSEAEIDALLDGSGGFAFLAEGSGFILCRSITDEAEILTLAVTPSARRKGLGRALVEAAAKLAAREGAEALFLEVAEDNTAAIALYRSAGFSNAGRRRRYYERRGGAVDALVMRRRLNRDG